MKTILIMVLLLFLNLLYANASSFKFTFDGTTGNIGIDTQIKDINISAKGNTDGVLRELELSVGIKFEDSKKIMVSYNLSFGEVYLLGILKLHSQMSINEILLLRQQGLGWGQIAHKLGMHPSTLNKAMRDIRKAGKGKSFKEKGKGRGKSKGKGKGKGKK